MVISEKVIHNTLHYSYYPNPARRSLPEAIASSASSNSPRTKLIERGSEALRASIRSVFEEEAFSTSSTHILLLSGGLDSRTVLALLLERVPPDQIITGSYGTPGSMDLEFGRMVADAAGVKNYTFDLRPSQFEWDHKDVLAYVKTLSYPNRIFESYINHYSHAQLEENATGEAVHWSGYIGETSSGAHDGHYLSDTFNWQAQIGEFAKWNNSTRINLTPTGFDPRTILPSRPLVAPRRLRFGEQLDYAVRQQCFIEPFVNPPGYFSPFYKEEWLQFALSLDRKHRKNRSLFRNIVRQTWSDLFSLPTETNNGLPLAPSGKGISWTLNRAKRKLRNVLPFAVEPYHPEQYFDFATALRTDNSFCHLVRRLLKSLSDRNAVSYIDIDSLWGAHQDQMDLNMELRILGGLELCIQACE